MQDPERDLDIVQLQTAVATAGRLELKQLEVLATVRELKRALVSRLVHKQHPHLTLDEEKKLFKGYGVER